MSVLVSSVIDHPKKTVLGLVLMAFGILLVMTDSLRFLKTLFLIARVAPYEQVGTGSGTIQFLGDSTGYGTGASSKKYSVAGRLGAEYPGYAIQNDSVNGRTIAGLLADTTDFAGQYDLIVLQIGANDILQKRAVGAIVADLEILLQRLAPHTKEIVMLTSGNIGTTPAFSGDQAAKYDTLTRAYQSKVVALAAKTPHFTYINLFDEPENDPFVQNPDKYTALDDLHPSNDGYALWYDKARSTFAQVLEQN